MRMIYDSAQWLEYSPAGRWSPPRPITSENEVAIKQGRFVGEERSNYRLSTMTLYAVGRLLSAHNTA